MSANLAQESYWTDKSYYHDAEKRYFESLAQLNRENQPVVTEERKNWKREKRDKNANLHGGDGACLIIEEMKLEDSSGGGRRLPSTLVSEVAKAREHIKTSLQSVASIAPAARDTSNDAAVIKALESVKDMLHSLEKRVATLEIKCASCPPAPKVSAPVTAPAKPPAKDDDVDLFGSESEDEEAEKVKQQRLAEYAAKKSKKPALIAKSSIILDVKPWDDETDMADMESKVREIEMEGLLWGASKLVPLAYGIKKLQINCVVEDEKVSVDLLQEMIEGIEELVQSVDIAAFNKI